MRSIVRHASLSRCISWKRQAAQRAEVIVQCALSRASFRIRYDVGEHAWQESAQDLLVFRLGKIERAPIMRTFPQSS